jgi:hypothetical protein
MKKEKKDEALTPSALLAKYGPVALRNAGEWGHTMGEFKTNGAICIATCARCKGAVIIHETQEPNGRLSGTAVNFRCTE